MNFPKRKYYNIRDAANLLSCDVNDIIHFGAKEWLDIYAYINHKNLTNYFHFQINMPSYTVDEIDCFDSLFFDDWCADGVQFHEKTDFLPFNGYYAKEVKGLFFIDSYVLTDLEFSSEKKATIDFFSDVNSVKNEFAIEFNTLGFKVEINTDALYIKYEDLDELNELCSSQIGESDKTLAKKENIIRALLELIPELSGVNVDSTPVKKLKEIIEATALDRGVEFPKTDLGTWSKYLERGRHKK
ncbi:hypothetical protein [Pectobacterium sp. IFB5596]|uniref:hypothetical protein n=1 Tax=Pectobacterium sp. IFB5596 TaxID=1839803 RepID=UPI001F3DB9D4|nr:hypothetical protein [Pectobacterium sp. IFB5596]MCE9731328.1 hypothetical protein [Pectobacterium sp. IFB5596]GKW11286.1 hypothetical protein PEC301899_15680 [Pectobacterium carotovorum subsp. carotovorum]